MVYDETWVELKTEEGKTYFWNRRDNSRAWALPEGVSIRWVGQKSPDGRTYYWSRDKKETVWVLPPLPESSEPSPGDAAANGDAPNVCRDGSDDENVVAPDQVAEPASLANNEAPGSHAQSPPQADVTGQSSPPSILTSNLDLAVNEQSSSIVEVKAKVEEEPPLLCHLPEIEPAGPRGDSASSVAARHLILTSGCDSWWHHLGNGEWEEVVRFWPPPGDLPLARAPKIKRPKSDPYGLRPMVMRCQQHEEMVRALLSAHYLTDSFFSAATFPCPQESEWCFWTGDGRQLLVNSERAMLDESSAEEHIAEKGFKLPLIRRCPPEGDRWKLLKGPLRSNISMVFKAVKLRKLEKLIRSADKEAVKSFLESFKTGPVSEKVPDKLAKAASNLLAPPPKAAPVQTDAISKAAQLFSPTAPAAQLGFPSTALAPSPYAKMPGVPPGPLAGPLPGVPMGPLPGVPPPPGPLPGVSPGPLPGISSPNASSEHGFEKSPSLPLLQPTLKPPPPGRPVGSPDAMMKSPPTAGQLLGAASSKPGPMLVPSMKPSSPTVLSEGSPELIGSGHFAKGKSAASSPLSTVGNDALHKSVVFPAKAPMPQQQMEAFAKGSPPSEIDREKTETSATDSPAVELAKASPSGPLSPPPGPLSLPEHFAKGSLLGQTAPGVASPVPTGPMPAPTGPLGQPAGLTAAGLGLVPAPPGPLAGVGITSPGHSSISEGMQSSQQTNVQSEPSGTIAGKAFPQASVPPTKAPPSGPIPQWKAAPPPPPPKAQEAPPVEAIAKPLVEEAAPAVGPAGPAVAPSEESNLEAQEEKQVPPAASEPIPTKEPVQSQVEEATSTEAPTDGKRPSDDAALAAEAPWAARKRRRGRAGVEEDSVPSVTTTQQLQVPVAPPTQQVQQTAAPESINTEKPETLAPALETTPLPTTITTTNASVGGVADKVAAQRVAAAAEKLAQGANATTPEALAAADLLKRKLIVANIMPMRPSELSDFFTGAIFSATGHMLAAQWQSGEAAKVVLAVDISSRVSPSGGTGTMAEVTFGTATGANVAMALNGIQFKGKALDIRRPPGYVGAPVKRSQLQNLALKDLVASDIASAVETNAPPSAANSNATFVVLSGIPSSMNEKSVYDLLQQFGGALKSLKLEGGADEHAGSGVAEYVDESSASEAVGFSPLLGFIEVKLATASASAEPESLAQASASSEPSAKRIRKNRFDPEPKGGAAEDDLGPFEAALRQRSQPPATSSAPAHADALDLGPFEKLLPPARTANDSSSVPEVVDLGPFEAVLPPAKSKASPESDGAMDLGPFEAVLPPMKAKASNVVEEDLGPFEAVLPPARSAPAQADNSLDDLGPFAAAIQGFERKH